MGTGRPVALMIPKAKKAAVRSSILTCNLINALLDAAKNASESGAFLDPGGNYYVRDSRFNNLADNHARKAG